MGSVMILGLIPFLAMLHARQPLVGINNSFKYIPAKEIFPEPRAPAIYLVFSNCCYVSGDLR
jgi:hypothetical protein